MTAIPSSRRRRVLGRTVARRVSAHVDARCQERDPTAPDRGETPAQRADRNFTELLQELRVAQTGVQLLFGFLLAIAFQTRFADIGVGQRVLYVATLVCCTAAFILLVAPVATHRALFQRRMKMVVVIVSHYLTVAGLGAMVVAVLGSVVLAVWQALGFPAAVTVGASCLVALLALWVAMPALLRRFLGSAGEVAAERQPARDLVSLQEPGEQPAPDDSMTVPPRR